MDNKNLNKENNNQHTDHCGSGCATDEHKVDKVKDAEVEAKKNVTEISEEKQEAETATKKVQKTEKVAEEVSEVVDNKNDDVNKNKGVAVIAYLIFFLPMIVAKDSKFAMYHANQSLVLFLFALGLNIILSVMFYTPIAMMLSPIIGITLIIFAIIGMVNASNGEMKELPLIGGIKILK